MDKKTKQIYAKYSNAYVRQYIGKVMTDEECLEAAKPFVKQMFAEMTKDEQ